MAHVHIHTNKLSTLSYTVSQIYPGVNENKKGDNLKCLYIGCNQSLYDYIIESCKFYLDLIINKVKN